MPPGVSAIVADAYLRYGAGSPAVRALAAEVAAAQQGIVAAQLMAHVAASGVAVHSMQVRVHHEVDGTQRVTLFVNGGNPVWATAPGLGPGGLLSLPGAAPATEAPAQPDEVDSDEYADPGEDEEQG